jgi:hypothetical protein
LILQTISSLLFSSQNVLIRLTALTKERGVDETDRQTKGQTVGNLGSI